MRGRRPPERRAVTSRRPPSRSLPTPIEGFVGCSDRERLKHLLEQNGYHRVSRGSVLPRPFELDYYDRRRLPKPLWFSYWQRDDGSQFELLDEYDSPFAREYGAGWARALAADLDVSPLALLVRVRRR